MTKLHYEDPAAIENSQVVGVSKPLPVNLGLGDITKDAWGIQKVSLPFSLHHGMFTFDIPEKSWFMYENGTQVYSSSDIVSTDGAAVLTTTVSNTDLMLQSRECPRYQPNRGHLFSTALWCPNKTNDGVRYWGIGTPENCAIFRLKADGLLYAVRMSGGVEVSEELIDTSTVSGFDVEKNNLYDIQIQWRGAGNYHFYINNTLAHSMDILGTLAALSLENPALPAVLGASRTTEDVAMHIGCVDITSENGKIDKEEYTSAYVENVSINTNTPAIIVHSPLLVAGATNTRSVTLARITFNCSKKATFKVWTTRSLADITGATFQPIGGGSLLECDSPNMHASAVSATSVNISNLRFVTMVPVQANLNEKIANPDPDRIIFRLVRGDYLIVTGTAAAGASDIVVEMGEQI